MDAVAILTLIGLVIGIIAGVVQVLDFLEKQREKKRSLANKTPSPQIAQVPGTPPEVGKTPKSIAPSHLLVIVTQPYNCGRLALDSVCEFCQGIAIGYRRWLSVRMVKP